MPKLDAILFADHHAGGGYRSRGVDDSLYSLNQIVDEAIRFKPKWLISLGDAVNSAVTAAEGPIPMRNMLHRAVDAGIKVGYIDGNHDKRVVSWLNDPDFVHLDKQTIHIGGRNFYGLDFQLRDDIKVTLAEKIPADVNGLLMHQAWGELMGFEDAPQCEIAQVPKHIDMIFSGDYHGRCVMKNYRGGGGQKVFFCNPGSTSLQNILEPEEKFIFGLDSDGVVSARPLMTRPVLRSPAIHTPEDLEDFLKILPSEIDKAIEIATKKRLPPESRKPFFHVTYSTGLLDVVRRVERLAAERVHLFWKEIRPDKKESIQRAAERTADGQGTAFTPLTMLPQVVDVNNEEDTLAKEVFALAHRLLVKTSNKVDVSAEINKWRQEVLGTEETKREEPEEEPEEEIEESEAEDD